MENVGGVYQVPIRLNDTITLDAIVDSGASDVSIPADVVLTLSKTISEKDFIDAQRYVLADGSEMPSQMFNDQVTESWQQNFGKCNCEHWYVTSQLLLGQSFLSRFGS
jgi:gag-polyprotein putative aspartyl protease